MSDYVPMSFEERCKRRWAHVVECRKRLREEELKKKEVKT